MPDNLKFEFGIKYGILDTHLICPVSAPSLYKAIELMGKHYFRVFIFKAWILRGGVKILIPEISNISVLEGLLDIKKIIDNAKVIQRKKYNSFKIK